MKEKLRPTDQLLRAAVDEINDYFRHLGGSGQYEGFCEWHTHALLLLLIIGIDPSAEKFYETEDSLLISPRVWRETDGLPEKIAAKLKSINFRPQKVNLFIANTTKKIADLSEIRELFGWLRFLCGIEAKLDRKLVKTRA